MPEKNAPTSLLSGKFYDPDLKGPVAAAFDCLNKTIIERFDERMWHMVEVCCSVIAVLMLKDAVNPVGVILVDNPSTGKTTALSLFYDLDIVRRCDAFTASSFVSHASNRRKEDLEKIDLLPQIQYKCLLTPELAPLFSKKSDDLYKDIGVLTRVFDGQGLWTNSGVHGGRGYKGDYFFTMLGATIPMPKHVWEALGIFGTRLLIYTLESETSIEERVTKTYHDVFESDRQSFIERVAACKIAVHNLFEALSTECAGRAFGRSIVWDAGSDSNELKRQIVVVAEFVARARSKVAVWDSTNKDVKTGRDFSQPLLEGPHRLTSVLYSLARAHAVISGRQCIINEDVAFVIEIALSSMPNDRRQVIDLLLREPGDKKTSERGTVDSTEIKECLTISKPTAIKLIEQLALLGIGDKIEGTSDTPHALVLKRRYAWFNTEQFAEYREMRKIHL